MEAPDQRVSKGRQALDYKALQGLQEIQVQMVLQDQLVIQVLMVCPGQQAHKVYKALQGQQVLMALMATQGQQAHKGQQGQPV
jgi:hypothetical protein